MASLSLLEQLSESASVWFPILLDVAAKGAAILILTAILALTMRRAPAATRHMVWLLGTCSLLILPVLSATLPGWHILPQWTTTTAVQAPAPAEFVSQADAGTAAYAAPQEETLAPELRPSAQPVAEYRHAPTDSGPWASTRVMSSLSWQAWVLLAWAGGTLILLATIAGGNFSLRWLEHRSGRVTDEDWLLLLSQLRAQLGIGRPVDLLCSAHRTMPMTWGLWRTRILLPADAENWSSEQRRAVLLHELAHAKRWDCLWQLAVQFTCALYWFNPLIWLSWHRIQTERERACDDLVLRSGAKPSAYAEQLLHIAEEMPTTRYSAAAIAMARPGTLEGRLRAILDSTRNRRGLAWSAVVLAVLLVGGFIVPLAMLRAQEQGRPTTTAVGAAQPDSQAWIELHGQVVDDASGKPIEHYAIQRGFVDPEDESKVSWGGETSSSRWAEGRFQQREGILRGQVAWFRVLAEGYSPAPITPKPVTAPAMESNLIIRLKKGVELRGQVLDHTGKPVAGALVMLAAHQQLGLTDGKPGAIYQGSRATTDADGRFALSGAGEPDEHVAVSTSSLNVWLTSTGEAGRELTIHLPQPATLSVHYDIEGAAEEALVRVELVTWDMPEWKGALNSVQYLSPRNGNVFVAANMTPGTYDIARIRKVRLGDFEREYMCDRTTLALAAGKEGTVDFVRKTGQQVKGTVTGLQGAGIADAAILIRSAEATGDPRNPDEWKKTIFDAVACGADGSFITSRLSPGRYKAIAEAYKPETPEEQFRSGLRMPALIATAELVVPETGVAAPIVIELKPLAAATQPAATQAITAEKPATAADLSSMNMDMANVMVNPAAAASSSIDSWTKYQEQRQAWANESLDGWSEVVHELRARFVPQAGVIKAGETLTISVEVENLGTEMRGFQVEAQVPVFDGAGTWTMPTMRRTGGSSMDTGAEWRFGSRVEPKKNVIVTGSLSWVLPREGEYRVRGKVTTESPIRGSNNHREDTWLILPELVLKVDAGDPAATLPGTTQPATAPSAAVVPPSQQAAASALHVADTRPLVAPAAPVQNQPASEQPAAPVPGSVANFNNGVRAELLGICSYPATGRQWWRPDGQLLPSPPPDFKYPLRAESTSEPLFPTFIFALRITNPNNIELKRRVESDAGFVLPVGFSGNQLFRAGFRDHRDKATIRIGAALEPWTTIMTADGHDTAFGVPGHVTGRIITKPSAENGGQLSFRLSHDFTDRETQLVVLTTDGQTLFYETRDRKQTYSVAGLKPDGIREFQFQTCRFEWKEFKDIPLRPKASSRLATRFEWRTSATAEMPFKKKSVDAGWFAFIGFIEPRQDGSSTVIRVEYMAPSDRQTRLIAITQDGTIRTSDKPYKALDNGVVNREVRFSDLSLDQVRAFAVQVESDVAPPAAAWFDSPPNLSPSSATQPAPGGLPTPRPLTTQPVRTVTYRETIRFPGQPYETQVIMIKDGRKRLAYPDGRVVIMSELEGKSLLLDPKHKLATISSWVNHRPDRPIYSASSVEKRADPGTRPVISLGKRQIGGRDVERIQFSHVVETTDGQRIDTPYTVWRDPISHRPVQISTPGTGKFYAHEAAADGKVDTFTFEQASSIMNDFVFDAPLDDSLFAIKVPEGYQVKQGTPSHFNNEDTSATRPSAMLTKRVIYKMSDAGGQKVSDDNCLDLESGRISPLRKELMDGPGKMDLPQWFKDNDIDLSFGRALVGIDLPAAKVDPGSWETMTAAEAQQVLEKAGASGVNTSGQGEFANMVPLEGEAARSAYAFRTRRGALGVMELRPVTDPRPGVMIRYRILTSAPGPARSH